MDLDLFRLRVFVTVVDRNGYSAAARRLNLAQATVSHHMSELERACGAQLVLYKDRGVHLTAAGQELYRVALSMLRSQDHLVATLGDLRKGQGRVRLGASLAFEQQAFMNEVIAPFCRSHQGTMLSLRFGHSRREAMAVLDRERDLAYVIQWHLPDEAEFELLHEVEVAFLAARDHPLATSETVSTQDIGAAGLITAPLTGAETDFFREMLRQHGLTGDHSVLEIDGQQSRFLAAAAGLGVLATFVPVGRTNAVSDSLVRLPVPGPLARCAAGLVQRRDEPASSSVLALADWLRRR